MVAVGALMAVALVAAAGYAYAAVTATNNTYTGCLQNGSVSNVAIGAATTRPCPPNAVQISWSQTGPQGASGATGPQGLNGETGATGPQGPNGDTGARGPSTAFTRNVDKAASGEDPILIPAGGVGVEVNHLNLPAGSFLLTASVQVIDSARVHGTFGECEFIVDGEASDGYLVDYDIPVNQSHNYLHLERVSTLTRFGSVRVLCTTLGGAGFVDDAVVYRTRVTALQVATLISES